MKREEYLKLLRNELTKTGLSGLDQKAVDDTVEFYNEMIEDSIESGLNEEEAVGRLSTPSKAAQAILQEEKKETSTDVINDSDYAKTGYPLKGIKIEAENLPVYVKSGEEFHVYFTKEKRDKVEVDVNEGIYSFKQSVPFSIHSFFGGGIPQKIVVILPPYLEGKVIVRTTNARIQASEINFDYDVELVSSNARIIINDLSINRLYAHTNNGRFEIEKLNCEEGIIETSNGRITLTEVISPKLSVETNNGMLSFTKVKVNDLQGITRNGSVTLDSLVVDHLDLRTTNSSVSGTIVGDMREYSFNCTTSNGSSSLPNDMSYPDQKKSVKIKTSNGKINVKFIA